MQFTAPCFFMEQVRTIKKFIIGNFFVNFCRIVPIEQYGEYLSAGGEEN